jgi:geranylgeranyl diphosphate synthase type I
MGIANTIRIGSRYPSGPALPAMFARYREGIEGELRAAIPGPERGLGWGDLPAGLYHMLQYHMGWADESGGIRAAPVSQGKALRPTLCLFACDALSEQWTTALPAAAALEFIHNFSLIHDDIQDQDLERRHQPTVWALWGPPQALVAGNAMRCLADVSALDLGRRGVSQEKVLRASCLITEGYLEMTAGQCMDLAFERTLDITLQDYLGMVSYKTGALLRCGMELGALVASDREDDIKAFAHAGGLLGLAFQIRDDVLGIWGDEATTGKAVGNDIRRRKKSLPVVYALESAKGSARRALVEAYSKDEPEDQDVERVLEVLEELNVAEYAHAVTREKGEMALAQLGGVPLAAWARREIEELVEFLTTRQR